MHAERYEGRVHGREQGRSAVSRPTKRRPFLQSAILSLLMTASTSSIFLGYTIQSADISISLVRVVQTWSIKIGDRENRYLKEHA